MKGKVIKIDELDATVGFDDGSTYMYDLDLFNYSPVIVGDRVEIFGDGNNTIISRDDVLSGQNVTVNITQSLSGKTKVNKIAYCVLAFFLGGFGIHQFYAKKVGSGIAMLLFCWTFIPSIIAFVQFFIALFKTADVNGMIEV